MFLSMVLKFFIGLGAIGILSLAGVPINGLVILAWLVIVILPVDKVLGVPLDPEDQTYWKPKDEPKSVAEGPVGTIVSTVFFILFVILIFLLI